MSEMPPSFLLLSLQVAPIHQTGQGFKSGQHIKK